MRERFFKFIFKISLLGIFLTTSTFVSFASSPKELAANLRPQDLANPSKEFLQRRDKLKERWKDLKHPNDKGLRNLLEWMSAVHFINLKDFFESDGKTIKEKYQYSTQRQLLVNRAAWPYLDIRLSPQQIKEDLAMAIYAIRKTSALSRVYPEAIEPAVRELEKIYNKKQSKTVSQLYDQILGVIKKLPDRHMTTLFLPKFAL